MLAALVLLLSGCANRSLTRFQALSGGAEAGRYEDLIAKIRKGKKLYDSRSDFLFHMDLGVLHHYAGQYDSSNAHLLKAAEILDGLYARSLTNEAAALLTNDNLRPYRSMPFEIALMHQFLALNYLALGKVDESLVETRRAQLLFNEWEKKRAQAGKFHDLGLFHYLSSMAFAAAGERDNSLISLIKAVKAFRDGGGLPEAVAQAAILQLKANDRAADLRLLGLPDSLENPAHAQAPARWDAAEIVLVGHAGRAPVLQETVFWGTWVKDGLLVVHYRNPAGDTVTEVLPAPGLPPGEAEKAGKGRKTKSGTTFHIKFAMPAMKQLPSRTRRFTVDVGGRTYRSVEMADTENLLAQYLEDSRKTILFRTVVRVVLRTMAQEKTKAELASANPLLNLAVSIGTDVLADQLEKADTRNCFLLPGSVHIVRMPVEPGSYRVEAQARGPGGEIVESRVFEQVAVRAGEKRFLIFASVR